MLASCAVLNEAHDQAIGFLSLNYNGGDLFLAELNERLDPTLATNKIVACRVRLSLSRANRDRTLESDVSDALYNLLEIPAIPHSGIEKANLVNWDGLYSLRAVRFGFAHAASWNGDLPAIE